MMVYSIMGCQVDTKSGRVLWVVEGAGLAVEGVGLAMEEEGVVLAVEEVVGLAVVGSVSKDVLDDRTIYKC